MCTSQYLSLSCRLAVAAENDDGHTAANVDVAGPAIIEGLLAALLAVSPLTRVHKVYTVMLSLACCGLPNAPQMLQGWVQNSLLKLSGKCFAMASRMSADVYNVLD